MKNLKSAFAAFIVNLWPVRWANNVYSQDCYRATLEAFGENPDDYA